MCLKVLIATIRCTPSFGCLARNHTLQICFITNYDEGEVSTICRSSLLEEIIFPEGELVEASLVVQVKG